MLLYLAGASGDEYVPKGRGEEKGGPAPSIVPRTSMDGLFELTIFAIRYSGIYLA